MTVMKADDEDGVMEPPMIFRGEDAQFDVELMVTNNDWSKPLTSMDTLTGMVTVTLMM